MDTENASENNLKNSFNDSQMEGECESYWLLKGPPFDQRDYMISPSESECDSVLDKDEKPTTSKSKIQLNEIRVDKKYILDSQGALKKLLELTKVECIEPLLGRFQNLIYKYLKGRPSGFLVEDLPAIIEIIEYFCEKQKSFAEFKNHIFIFINVSKSPPIMSKGLDILKCKNILADYFTMFGELLATFEDECFQLEILHALNAIVFRRNFSNLNSVKLPLCIEALEKSQLPYVVAVLLETVCFNLYFYYLDLAIRMTVVSVKAGFLMLQNNIINFILKRLNFLDYFTLPDEQQPDAKQSSLNYYYLLLDKSSYLIWSLLATVSKKDVRIPIPDVVAFQTLKNVFDREIMKKSQKAYYARNNIAGLIIKFCSVFDERLPLHQAGWVEDIAVLSVLTELGAQKSCLEGCVVGTKKEDYILKKLMLLGCCLLPKKKEEIETLKKYRVIEGVLVLISSITPDPWFPCQFYNLFRLGLRTLSELMPYFYEELISCKVISRILTVINKYKKEEFQENLLHEILMTVYTIITYKKNCCAIENLKIQSGEELLLELYSYLINIESMKIEDQEKLSKVLIVLEKVLRNDQQLLIFHSQCITSNTIALIKRIFRDSSNDSKWDPKLLISLGVFMWETIALCNESLQKFIEQGGIFILLDFIEASLFPIQMFFLGILVEMTLEGENIAHLLTWRGKDGYGMLDLMINIWKKEEYFTKVLRTPQGFIEDIENPLMTEEQRLLTLEIENGHNYCASVAEMVGSARPKIHALYHFLHQQYSDLTEIGESSYSVQFLNVQPSNQVYVPLIEHYLSLKMGEVWYEVLRDIHINGISPTAFDGDVLCTLLENKKNWSSRVRTVQEEIASFQQENGTDQEKGFYKLLHSCRLTPALEALRELDFIGRTSFKKFQIEKKRRQIQNIKKSLEILVPDDNVHRTFLCKTNVTFIDKSNIFIKSEKQVSMGEKIQLVSSESSDDNHFDSGDEI